MGVGGWNGLELRVVVVLYTGEKIFKKSFRANSTRHNDAMFSTYYVRGARYENWIYVVNGDERRQQQLSSSHVYWRVWQFFLSGEKKRHGQPIFVIFDPESEEIGRPLLGMSWWVISSKFFFKCSKRHLSFEIKKKKKVLVLGHIYVLNHWCSCCYTRAIFNDGFQQRKSKA